MTNEYLLSAAKGQVFTLTYSHVNWLSSKPVTKNTRSDLVEILSKLTVKNIGFSAEHLPNKKWLDPDNKSFLTSENQILQSLSGV